MSKRILYWLQNDLRIDDNPILSELATEQCALDIVFVINPHWFKNNNYQQKPYGVHKQQFLMQSLFELQQALIERGQTLHVLEGETFSVLKQRIAEQHIDEVTFIFADGQKNAFDCASVSDSITHLFEVCHCQ